MKHSRTTLLLLLHVRNQTIRYPKPQSRIDYTGEVTADPPGVFVPAHLRKTSTRAVRDGLLRWTSPKGISHVGLRPSGQAVVKRLVALSVPDLLKRIPLSRAQRYWLGLARKHHVAQGDQTSRRPMQTLVDLGFAEWTRAWTDYGLAIALTTQGREAADLLASEDPK